MFSPFADSTVQALAKAREFAARNPGKLEDLEAKLAYLDTYAEHGDRGKTRCALWPDFAPYSFEFHIEIRNADGEYERYMNGGLIFHGKHDGGGNGGAPTFSVSLSPVDGWSIHT